MTTAVQHKRSDKAKKYLSNLVIQFLEYLHTKDIKSQEVADRIDWLDNKWQWYCTTRNLTKESYNAFVSECEYLVKKIEEANEISKANEASKNLESE
jgi:hypothetical protein